MRDDSVYELLALIGFIGLAAVAGLGFLHHGAGDHGSTAHSVGGDHAGGHHVLVGAKSLKLVPTSKALSFLPTSPIDFFALCLGGGAAGLAAAGTAEPLRAVVALAGAIGFEFLVCKPLLKFFLSFASPPSEGLGGTVAKVGRAETRFDEDGRGLVALELDGETVQVLAHLEPSERARGVLVGRGQTIVVTAVDERRNSVTVTRELAPDL